MTMRRVFTLAAAICTHLLAPPASAEKFLGEMEWSVLIPATIQGFSEDTLIEGAASFVYDTGGVNPVGEDQLFVEPLRSFWMTPLDFTNTTWDLGNTAALLEFQDSELQFVFVGDGTLGPDNIRRMNTHRVGGVLVDDFQAIWREPALPQFPGRFGINNPPALVSVGLDADVTFTATPIPEPATLALLVLCGAAQESRSRPRRLAST